MPNPKAAFDKAPDPIVAAGVAPRTPDGRLLFLKRQGGDFAGHWCFPGGGVEDGEDAEQAARRETQEETGHDLTGPMREIGRMVRRGVDYTTHVADVADPFEPVLNDEHSEHVWATPDEPPAPLHPGVKGLLASTDSEDWSPPVAANDGLALDRASIRVKDKDGRLHVQTSHIAKACVSPYRGEEIPGWQALGLDPNRIYQLLRDPAELEAAVPKFNNKPLLIIHKAVSAEDHDHKITVGTIGSSAVWNDPYIDNSLAVWTQEAIDIIESEEQKELSPSYYYTPDMTPGSFKGQHYDGVMRNIECNHVALVPEGRQGHDVAVSDSKKDYMIMAKVKLTRKATEVRGALIAYLTPKLAADAKINLIAPFTGVDAKTFTAKKAGIISMIKASASGKLAQDATLDDLNILLDKLDDTGMLEPDGAEIDMDDTATDIDPEEAAKAFLKGKLDPEDYAKFEAMLTGSAAPSPAATAADADPDDDDDDDKVSKAAMDAAIADAAKSAERSTVQRLNGVQDALREVRPWVGELAMSFDSADAVRRHTLKMLGVEGAADIHESALATLINAQPKPGARPSTPVAMDAAAAKSFADRFPNAARIRTY